MEGFVLGGNTPKKPKQGGKLPKDMQEFQSFFEFIHESMENDSSPAFNPFQNEQYSALVFLIDFYDGLNLAELNSFFSEAKNPRKKINPILAKRLHKLEELGIIVRKPVLKKAIHFNRNTFAVEERGESKHARFFLNGKLFDLLYKYNNLWIVYPIPEGKALSQKDSDDITAFADLASKIGADHFTETNPNIKRAEIDKVFNAGASAFTEMTTTAPDVVKPLMNPDFYFELERQFNSFYASRKSFQAVKDFLKMNRFFKFSKIFEMFFESVLSDLILLDKKNPAFDFPDYTMALFLYSNILVLNTLDSAYSEKTNKWRLAIEKKFEKTSKFKEFQKRKEEWEKEIYKKYSPKEK